MATASLIEATSFFKDPPKIRPFSSSPLRFNPLLHKSPHFSFPAIRNPNLVIRVSSRRSLKPVRASGSSTGERNQNPFAALVKAIAGTLESLKKPAIAVILLGVLLASDPYSALAASGGRMGGRSFSSSSSSRSRSYSAPPSSSFSYSVPYYAPSPFGAGGGFYVGPAFGVGFGAGSGVFLLMMGFAAVILLSGFLSDRDDGSVLTAAQKTSVLKLQVCAWNNALEDS